jgi:hypothetical protein
LDASEAREGASDRVGNETLFCSTASAKCPAKHVDASVCRHAASGEREAGSRSVGFQTAKVDSETYLFHV